MLVVKNPSASAADVRVLCPIFGSRRSPGGGHGNTLQYSCLENSIDRGAWRSTVHRVTKSWTLLKHLSTHSCKKFFFLQWGLLRLSLYFRSYSVYLIKLAFCFVFKTSRISDIIWLLAFSIWLNFTWHNALNDVCPCCCRWQDFFFFFW